MVALAQATAYQQAEYDKLTAEAMSLISQLPSDEQEEYNTKLDGDKIDFLTDPAGGLEALENLVLDLKDLV